MLSKALWRFVNSSLFLHEFYSDFAERPRFVLSMMRMLVMPEERGLLFLYKLQ